MPQKKPRGAEPTLKELIAESGETEAPPLRKALSEDKTDRKFLGREFLTWLLYHAEQGGGRFNDADEGAFTITPGERILLRAMGEAGTEIAARGSAPAQTADVRYAVAGGLTVREADLIVQRGEETWQVAVHADLFDLKRVKLPDLQSEEALDRAAERLTHLDRLDAMLKTAFSAFLALRLRPAWAKKTVPLLRQWLMGSILHESYLPDGDGDNAGQAAKGAKAATQDDGKDDDSHKDEAGRGGQKASFRGHAGSHLN